MFCRRKFSSLIIKIFHLISFAFRFRGTWKWNESVLSLILETKKNYFCMQRWSDNGGETLCEDRVLCTKIRFSYQKAKTFVRMQDFSSKTFLFSLSSMSCFLHSYIIQPAATSNRIEYDGNGRSGGGKKMLCHCIHRP